MKSAMIVLLAASLAAGAFGGEWSDIWPVPELPAGALYTNAYARELHEAISNRSNWVGLTNWSSGYSNTYLLHEHLEEFTDRLELVLPQYLSTNYSRGDDWSFDYWFSNAPTSPVNWRVDWPPLATKADLFDHLGVGIVLNRKIVTLLGDQYSVTNGTGLFTKRKGRKNPLIVKQWLWNPALDPAGLWWSSFPAKAPGQHESQWNEFVDEGDYKTTMPDFTPDQHPVFVYIPGATGGVTYAGGIVAKWDDLDTYSVQTGTTELFLGPYPTTQQSLNSATTRADYAFVSRAGEGFWLEGTPPNTNDRVVLYWDAVVTTYQGSATWDWILLPEQLNEHQSVASNLFLMPWTQWHWTNSVYYNNYYLYSEEIAAWAAYEVDEHPDPAFHLYADSPSGSTNRVYPPDPNQVGIPWWDPYGCPWYDDLEWPDFVPPASGVATNPQEPYFTYTLAATSGVEQSFLADVNWCMTIGPVNPEEDFGNYPEETWNWYADLFALSCVSITGVSVSSEIAITGLWNGTPRRAHIYARWPVGDGHWFERKQIVPAEGYSTDPVLYSEPIDLWTNFPAGVLMAGGCGDSSNLETNFAGWTIDNGTVHTTKTLSIYLAPCMEGGYGEDVSYTEMYTSNYFCDETEYFYSVDDITTTIDCYWDNVPGPSTNVYVSVLGWELICDPTIKSVWSGAVSTSIEEYGDPHVHSAAAMQSGPSKIATSVEAPCPHDEFDFYRTNVINTTCYDQSYGYTVTDADLESRVVTEDGIYDAWRARHGRSGQIVGFEYNEAHIQTNVWTNVTATITPEVKILIEWKP